MMRYYMFNKPRGCVTARRDARHRTVMDYFPECDRDVLFPVGRLDRDTVGFLLVTDDGQLCTRLMRPEGHIEKTYFFVAKGEITDENVTRLEGGIDISVRKMAKTLPASLEIIERTTLGEVIRYLDDDNRKIALSRPDLPAFIGKLTITEGKKHQVKRMIRHFGAKVVYLRRISLGGVPLDESLPEGSYRELTAEELEILKR